MHHGEDDGDAVVIWYSAGHAPPCVRRPMPVLGWVRDRVRLCTGLR